MSIRSPPIKRGAGFRVFCADDADGSADIVPYREDRRRKTGRDADNAARPRSRGLSSRRKTMTPFTHRTHRVRAIALRTVRHAALAGALLASAVTAMAQTDTPIGTWQTIDDHTGQPKALVQITQDSDGELSGKVIKGLGANNQPDRRCTQCTDARKDQLVLGMTIID